MLLDVGDLMDWGSSDADHDDLQLYINRVHKARASRAAPHRSVVMRPSRATDFAPTRALLLAAPPPALHEGPREPALATDGGGGRFLPPLPRPPASKYRNGSTRLYGYVEPRSTVFLNRGGGPDGVAAREAEAARQKKAEWNASPVVERPPRTSERAALKLDALVPQRSLTAAQREPSIGRTGRLPPPALQGWPRGSPPRGHASDQHRAPLDGGEVSDRDSARVSGPGGHVSAANHSSYAGGGESAEGPPAEADGAAPPVESGGEAKVALAIERYREANSQLMLTMADERMARQRVCAERTVVEAQLTDYVEHIEEGKVTIRAHEAAVRKCVLAEKEFSSLQRKVKQRDAQNRELSSMLRTVQERLDSLSRRSQAVASEAHAAGIAMQGDVEGEQGAPVDGSGTGAIKSKLRSDIQMQVTTQRQVEVLKAKKDALLVALSRHTNFAKDGQRKAAVALERLERDISEAKRELESRAAQDLDRELAHMRETDALAMRHRKREVEAKTSQDRRALLEVETRYGELSAAAKQQAHSLETLRASVDVSRRHLAAEQRLLELKREEDAAAGKALDRALEELATLERVLGDLRRDISVVEGDVADQGLQRAAARDRQRQALSNELTVLQEKEKRLAASLPQLEEDLDTYLTKTLTPLKDERANRNQALSTLMERCRDLTQRETAAAAKVAEAKTAELQLKGVREQMEKKDIEIRQRTQSLAALTAEEKQLHRDNTELLEKLDHAERLVGLGGGDP